MRPEDLTALDDHRAAKKPPIGIMPRRIWLEQRAQEVSRAICRYVEAGYFTDRLDEFLTELECLVDEIGK